MIYRHLFFMALFLFELSITQGIFAQNNWQTFANVERYREANEKLEEMPLDENRVVFMGNSITEAWPVISPEFFASASYIGRGISGQTTPQMVLRFRHDVINLKPKIVVLLAGTNDVAGNTGDTTIDEIAGNIKTMVELASENGIKVIISSVLPAIDYPWKPGREPAKKIRLLNEKLRDYAHKNKHVYLDYYSSLVDEKGGLKVPEYTAADDLVHPNKAGYLVMEKLVESAINKALSN